MRLTSLSFQFCPCSIKQIFSLQSRTTASMSSPMRRNARREFTCKDFPDFRPNVSPKEMFQQGIFGGTYFRDIEIGEELFKDAWKEFTSQGWFQGLDIKTMVSNQDYKVSRNRYKVKCGQGLDVWVDKGWIKTEFDSHGWVHWYCRFFLGRRCADDERQIGRWKKVAGEKGRWRRNLIAKCVKSGRAYDDEGISPTVRQLLLHWAYELTHDHYEEYKELLEQGHRTSFIPQVEMKHVVKDAPEESENDEEADQRKRRQEDNDARDQRRRTRARNA